ncbi:hypothetical protein HK102_008411, partial [Quaeritorhiza haematococci]
EGNRTTNINTTVRSEDIVNKLFGPSPTKVNGHHSSSSYSTSTSTNSPTGTTRIPELPVDVLARVMAYLDQEDRISCRSVSYNWSDAARQMLGEHVALSSQTGAFRFLLVKYLARYSTQPDGGALKKKRSGRSLSTSSNSSGGGGLPVEVSPGRTNPLQSLLDSTFVRSLRVPGGSSGVEETLLKSIARVCPNLHTLEIHSKPVRLKVIATFFRWCHSLCVLRLQSLLLVDPADLLEDFEGRSNDVGVLKSGISRLRRLEFWKLPPELYAAAASSNSSKLGVSAAFWTVLAENVSDRLRTFTLDREAVMDPYLSHFLNALTTRCSSTSSLRSVWVHTATKSMVDDLIHRLATHAPRLKALYLGNSHYFYDVSVQSVTELVTGCPELELFVLNHQPDAKRTLQSGDSILKGLLQRGRGRRGRGGNRTSLLRNLCLPRLDLDAGQPLLLKWLDTQGAALEGLSLPHCTCLGDATLLKILQKCTRLRRLEITGAGGRISARVVSTFLKAWKKRGARGSGDGGGDGEGEGIFVLDAGSIKEWEPEEGAGVEKMGVVVDEDDDTEEEDSDEEADGAGRGLEVEVREGKGRDDDDGDSEDTELMSDTDKDEGTDDDGIDYGIISTLEGVKWSDEDKEAMWRKYI